MVVCQHAGELVGLVGGQVVRSGTFDVVAGRPDLVEVDGANVSARSTSPQLYARVQTRRPLGPVGVTEVPVLAAQAAQPRSRLG